MSQTVLMSMLLLPVDATVAHRELDSSGAFLVPRGPEATPAWFETAAGPAGSLKRAVMGVLLLLAAVTPARSAVPARYCLKPMPAMAAALRERIAPEALCKRALDAMTIALPIHVAPQEATTRLGRVTTEYAERPAANAWLVYAGTSDAPRKR